MAGEHARVLMLTPDLDEPIGGVKIHYQVVDTLNRAGIDTLVVHREPGFRCSWFQNDTPVADVHSLRASRHDVVVIPEEWIGFVPDLPIEMPKVVFHQNSYSTFSWGVEASVVSAVLQRPDVKRAVVVSDDNAAYLRYAFPGLDVQRMRYTIDPTVFSPPEPAQKKRQLAYMPRRRAQESSDVLSLLRVRGALGEWRVVAIDNMPEAQVAATLRESAVFLSFSLREGLPLPPAEAMACGCVVIGFHGLGGRDFGDNAIWVPEGDVVEFAQTVESTIATWDSDGDRFRNLTDRASSSILDTYSTEHTERDVRSAFGFPIAHVPAGGHFVVPDSMWRGASLGRRLLERATRAARVMLRG